MKLLRISNFTEKVYTHCEKAFTHLSCNIRSKIQIHCPFVSIQFSLQNNFSSLHDEKKLFSHSPPKITFNLKKTLNFTFYEYIMSFSRLHTTFLLPFLLKNREKLNNYHGAIFFRVYFFTAHFDLLIIFY